MPRFLAPITVAQEYVTTNETISGSETILGATSGKDSYWTTVNVVSGLSADYGSYVHNVSAAYFYGDGSNLTGISHIDNTKLPLSGGTLTNGLTGTTGIFTTSLSAPSLNGTHYGNGINLTNLNASNISTGTLSTSILPAFNGDISTTLNSTVSTTVIKLQGRPISTSTPSNGQILQWNGTAWVPGSIATGGSGGGGVTYYFDYGNYTGVSPTTGLPTSPVAPSLLGREYSVGAGSLQSGELTQNVYSLVAGFVTLSSEPAVTNIPAGLWDFNIWVDIVGNNSPNQTSMQIRVYKYASSTSTYTALASSDYVYIYDPDIIAQYIASVTMPQTTILSSDRIYIEFWAAKSVNQSRAIRFWFDSSHPSHVHTTIPSVAGSGLVKTINGVYQTPASLLVDVDVASNAEIAQSKISGLTTSLAGKVNTSDVIPISAGGTGQSNAAAGLSALGGFPISGGTITDGLTATSGTFTSYLSSPSISGTHYGSGINLTGIARTTDIQTFALTGTYTWIKPTGAKSVNVICIGGGGGGASGRRSASSLSAAYGGGGGAGGGFTSRTIDASLLSSSEIVIVGAGGLGATAQTVDNTDGRNGNSGATSSFGSWVFAGVGTFAGQGTALAGLAGSAASERSMIVGGGGGSSSITANAGGGGNSQAAGGGGGAGGGISLVPTAYNGGAGGIALATYSSGGASLGGTTQGGNGLAGASGPANWPLAGSGGSGGAASTTTAAGSGGAGGLYGGAGGGGGGSLNGFNSGAGGNGAQGIVVVTTYF